MSPSTSGVHKEMSELFSWNTATSLGKSKGKRPLATSSSCSSKRKRLKMWSHTFFCLSKVDHYQIPDASERITLKLAGLGEKKFSVIESGSSKELQDELFRQYPKLIDAGGYELLRAPDQGGKELIPIEVPCNGYYVEYLHAAVNSAKIYIRPLQRNLDVSPVLSEVAN